MESRGQLNQFRSLEIRPVANLSLSLINCTRGQREFAHSNMQEHVNFFLPHSDSAKTKSVFSPTCEGGSITTSWKSAKKKKRWRRRQYSISFLPPPTGNVLQATYIKCVAPKEASVGATQAALHTKLLKERKPNVFLCFVLYDWTPRESEPP